MVNRELMGKEKPMRASLRLNRGCVSPKTIQLDPKTLKAKTVEVTLASKQVNATLAVTTNGVSVKLESSIEIAAGEELVIGLK